MMAALQHQGKRLLLRAFDIREGEYRRVLLMQLHIFLIILCLWIIKPVVNAHFLAKAGIGNLPLVFLMVALTALLLTNLYARLLRRRALASLIFSTYVIAISGIVAMGLLLRLHVLEQWVVYPFYIGVALFGLVTTSQFWILANLVFDAAEARRLFGFIGAGAIAGGVGGGYITSVLAPVLNSENLLFIAAALLAGVLFINRTIWRDHIPEERATARDVVAREEGEAPWRLVRRHRLLTYLALIMGISVVVAKLVEFQFSAIASATITDPDRLAAFFGFWFSSFNVVSLIIQLFLTQRIVGSYGIGRALFILPGALFLGTIGVIMLPVLALAITLKLLDVSLKQSINKAATELLVFPLSLAVKSQAKTFIDVFVDTTATGIGGLLLLFVVRTMEWSIPSVGVLILGLLLIWMWLALRIRRAYLLAFQSSLNLEEPEKPHPFRLSRTSAVESIRRAIRQGNESQLRFLLQKVAETRDQRLIPEALPHLEHPSPNIRLLALQCLYHADNHACLPRIQSLLRDTDPEVRYQAFATMLAHIRQDRIRTINTYLAHPDPVISTAALVGLAAETRNNPEMRRLYDLDQLIRDRLEQAERHPAQLADRGHIAHAIGYGQIQAFYPQLETWMEAPDETLAANALHGAAKSEDPRLIPAMTRALIPRRSREAATRALLSFPFPTLLHALRALVSDPETPLAVLLQLPPLLAEAGHARSTELLVSLLDIPFSPLQTAAMRALQNQQARWPQLHGSEKKLRQHLLRESAHLQSIRSALLTLRHSAGSPEADRLLQHLEQLRSAGGERLFRLLSLCYPDFQVFALYERLREPDPAFRHNALELLDNLLEPPLKHAILPVLRQEWLPESAPAQTEPERSSYEVLDLLLGDQDASLRMDCLQFIASSDIPQRAALLHKALQDPDVHVRNVAADLLHA